MRSDWKSNKNKIIVMLKRLIGIFVGLTVTVFGMIILGNEKSLIGWLSMWYLPMLLGGITAGYFTRDKGWISGLIVAGILVGYFLFYDLSDKAPLIYVLWYSMGLLVGAAGGYLGQFLTQISSVKMRRKIIGAIIGLFTAFASFVILFYLIGDVSKTCSFNEGRSWVKDLIYFCLPFFVGGIFAGIIARQRGWICGLLSGFVLLVFILTTMICISLGSPIISAFAMYEWSFICRKISELISMLAPSCWLILGALLLGAFGGHLGQVLAHKWHKEGR